MIPKPLSSASQSTLNAAPFRGNGWGKKHATVNYVFEYSPYRLYAYHCLIMEEMTARGYKVSPEWRELAYRGKTCPAYSELEEEGLNTPSILSIMRVT